MAWALDDLSIGGQMQVGTGKVPAIGIGRKKINGSGHVEGPMVVGNPTSYAGVDACLMVAPLKNKDPDCPHPFKSIGTSGGLDVGLKVLNCDTSDINMLLNCDSIDRSNISLTDQPNDDNLSYVEQSSNSLLKKSSLFPDYENRKQTRM